VTVGTDNGRIVYPTYSNAGENPIADSDSMRIAAENYRILQEGLNVNVDVTFQHNTLISNLILGGYSFVFLLGLYFYYRTGVRRFMAEEHWQRENIDNLVAMEKSRSQKLFSLTQNREELVCEIKKTRKQLEDTKSKVGKNEDDFIEEIVKLEEKITKNIAFQDELQKKIKSFEQDKRADTPKTGKDRKKIKKKFSVLYKNTIVHDRAISGFMALSDDLQIKSEEIIHQLNYDSQQVLIKRKVFSKKSRVTVLEVLFAYKGRLYFRNIKGKIEILSIGTKNSQAGDLTFLDNL